MSDTPRITAGPLEPVALDGLVLSRGGHKSREDGVCVMEAVAWFAGEAHSERPRCASPVLTSFLTRWNDDMDEAGRQRLKPYVPRVVGTAGQPKADQRVGWMLIDWMVRTHTPAWLRLAKLDQAAALEALPEITEVEALRAATSGPLQAARESADAASAAAWAAVSDAAWDAEMAAASVAARVAASDAASDAAWVAASDAASAAASAAAWAAAWDAERDAARAAAYSKAREALKPTEIALQDSALALLDRMLREYGR